MWCVGVVNLTQGMVYGPCFFPKLTLISPRLPDIVAIVVNGLINASYSEAEDAVHSYPNDDGAATRVRLVSTCTPTIKRRHGLAGEK